MSKHKKISFPKNSNWSHRENPAELLRSMLANPEFRRHWATRLGHPDPDNAEIDEQSFEDAARYFNEAVEYKGGHDDSDG